MGKVQQISRRHSQSVKATSLWLYLQLALALMLIFAGVVMLLWLGLGSNQSWGNGSNPSLLQRGQPAPNFNLPSLSGESVRLSELVGQVGEINAPQLEAAAGPLLQ